MYRVIMKFVSKLNINLQQAASLLRISSGPAGSLCSPLQYGESTQDLEFNCLPSRVKSSKDPFLKVIKIGQQIQLSTSAVAVTRFFVLFCF